ncbi:hypothetical protein BEI67_15830 [Photobacterium damselae subsp. piscicida]|uniref:toxin VasX n=1 Tax=Photobacterium damselae TaxID=38293 RepID=UPI00083EE182|nr:toxin VasX [Photobacterium damselae]OLQ79615.1 hypothetical protein BEI67_15830 [Photobacterium damselae subsp. piscicida]
MPSDAYNSAEIAGTKSPSSPAGTCPLQTKEVGIIPVRYAIDATMGTKGLFPLPEGDDWQPTFNINLPYTLRQLRDGWLYVYSKKQKYCIPTKLKTPYLLLSMKAGHVQPA